MLPRRNNVLYLLVLPMAIFLWCIGWSLYCVGSKNEQAKPQQLDQLKEPELIFAVPTPEQQYAT